MEKESVELGAHVKNVRFVQAREPGPNCIGRLQMNRKSQDKYGWHPLLAGLLSVLVALNMSQAVVVCVGADGHIAIETAGHHHCDHDPHADDPDHSPVDTGEHSHAADTPCMPCTDIPVCAGALEHPSKPSHSRTGVFVPVDFVAPSDRAAADTGRVAGLESLPLLATYFVPLRTVVLLV